MKITKSQLKQIIKEEMLKETDWYDLEKDELPSHVKKPPGRSGADVEAERALLSAIDSLAALDYSREDIMDLVTDLVDTSSQGKPEDQEDWPEDKDEEEVVDLRDKTPDIARLRRKLKYGFEDWRK